MNSDTPAMERKVPDAWRDEWSRELSQPLAEASSAECISMLVFRVGAEWFSLPARTAVEVTHVPVIHRMPHRTAGVGVINVRGRIAACVDLASLLGPINKNDMSEDRLVVFKHEDWIFASRVDAVDGVHRLELHSIDPPPQPIDADRFTSGLWTLAGRSVARLDEQRLFAAAREALS